MSKLPASPSFTPSTTINSARESDEVERKFNDDDILVTKTLLLTGSDSEDKREEIRDYFHRTFSLYEALFEQLTSDSSYYHQPDKLRHPLIFYYGHTAVFFINKLMLAKTLTSRINARIESVCAVGVDEMSWDDLNASHYDWPTVADVRDYRDQVRVTVDRTISELPLTLPIDWTSPFWPILMGIEHERIHLETSSVLFRQLPISEIQRQPMWKLCSQYRSDPLTVPVNRMVSVPGGSVTLHKLDGDATYGWDNEYGHSVTTVQAFQTSAFLVSNAEYKHFIDDGGYDCREYWGEEGWNFLQYRGLRAPVFWIVDNDGTYRYRHTNAELDMPWDWPVDVNYLEAKAFCNWKSVKTGKTIRLPTEAEWHRLRDWAYPLVNDSDDSVNDQPHWTKAPGNINLEHWSSASPIDMFPFGGSGLYDVIGNVWQHTETPINGFKGFRYHPLYDDFSVPTFDTRHNLIKGGSFISTGNEALRNARYAFRRHFYQHAGFRYVESEAPVSATDSGNNFTERDTSVCEVVHQQYATNPLNIPSFHAQLATIAVDAMKATGQSFDKALDMGCGAGRLSFELTKHFASVTGLDATARIIRVAAQLQSTGSFQYVMRHEGQLESFEEVDLKSLGLTPSTQCELVFQQADACNLNLNKHHGFGLVVAANLIERLYEPKRFLSSIASHLRPGGVLVLASAYDWNESVTPVHRWLGGFKENGESVETVRGIESVLESQFTRIGETRELPLVSHHHHARSFTVQMSQVTLWQRKSDK